MREELNTTELCGVVATEPVFSHENHGQEFYRFTLEIERLSGSTDRIAILALSSTLAATPVTVGTQIRVLGQLRTYNNRNEGGRRLVISVLANIIAPWDGESCNVVRLCGTLCKPPVLRRTPLGRSICDVMLAVNRRYGRSDYLPCIAWGQLAIQIGSMEVGSQLRLEGRIQSRIYSKVINGETEERTAYEVSVMQLLPEAEEECE
ncbi:MAG: single-stranded DNA-binding protein [Oscillospiraceae bacterium]|nr:single-stranded DNA-binding protein [Oscillospiraceae bacterium]